MPNQKQPRPEEYSEEKRPFDDVMRQILKAKPKQKPKQGKANKPKKKG